jgi:16S rRNA (guanine966-N2)-methyltransferase
MSKQSKKGSIRIISGEWRGRKIPVLDAQGLRPTTDRVRETLFNWLMYDVREAKCLDLFAGTGALGIECLSRGAKSVTFVESNKSAVDAIETFLTTVAPNSWSDNVKIENRNAINYLGSIQDADFDLVFLDPPFSEDLCAPAVLMLEEKGCLADQALIYIEQSVSSDLVSLPKNWLKLKEGNIGQSAYYLYQRQN